MAVLALIITSCTKDDVTIPNNASVQTKERSTRRVEITSEVPIVNNTIIAMAGTTVELYVTPYNEGNSCKWTVNGQLATNAHGPSMSITSNRPGKVCTIQVMVFDAADRASISPMIKVKWVSQ